MVAPHVREYIDMCRRAMGRRLKVFIGRELQCKKDHLDIWPQLDSMERSAGYVEVQKTPVKQHLHQVHQIKISLTLLLGSAYASVATTATTTRHRKEARVGLVDG